MEKLITDWEKVIKDKVICKFWNVPEELKLPAVGRLSSFTNGKFMFDYGVSRQWMHCDLLFPEDKRKYSKTVYEGRDNFIKALEEGLKIKVEVNPELSTELQEIAFKNGYCWQQSESVVVSNLSSGLLSFNLHEKNWISHGADSKTEVSYSPETDSFEDMMVPFTGRNLVDRFQERRPFKVKVSGALSRDIQNIAIGCGCAIEVKCLYSHWIIFDGKGLSFWSCEPKNNQILFASFTEYNPKTDSFNDPEYRPCRNWEELEIFWGKTVICKTINKDDSEAYALVGDVRVIDSFTTCNVYVYNETGKYWFHHWELCEPLNGSKVIGVKV